MGYRIIIEKRVLKDINSFPKFDALRISNAINNLSGQPRPHGCLKLESNAELYRIKVGDYRIIYNIRDKELVVCVVKIAKRKESYR